MRFKKGKSRITKKEGKKEDNNNVGKGYRIFRTLDNINIFHGYWHKKSDEKEGNLHLRPTLSRMHDDDNYHLIK